MKGDRLRREVDGSMGPIVDHGVDIIDQQIHDRIIDAHYHVALEVSDCCRRGNCAKAKECLAGYDDLVHYLQSGARERGIIEKDA